MELEDALYASRNPPDANGFFAIEKSARSPHVGHNISAILNEKSSIDVEVSSIVFPSFSIFEIERLLG